MCNLRLVLPCLGARLLMGAHYYKYDWCPHLVQPFSLKVSPRYINTKPHAASQIPITNTFITSAHTATPQTLSHRSIITCYFTHQHQPFSLSNYHSDQPPQTCQLSTAQTTYHHARDHHHPALFHLFRSNWRQSSISQIL